jgi:hypothetical protein
LGKPRRNTVSNSFPQSKLVESDSNLVRDAIGQLGKRASVEELVTFIRDEYAHEVSKDLARVVKRQATLPRSTLDIERLERNIRWCCRFLGGAKALMAEIEDGVLEGRYPERCPFNSSGEHLAREVGDDEALEEHQRMAREHD